MRALARQVPGASAWLAMAGLIAAHIGLAVLAARELTALRWLAWTWFDMIAVSVVLGTAVAGLSGAVIVLCRALRGSRRLRAFTRSARVPCPAPIADAAADLGLAGRVDAVRATEPFVVSHGLLRPRILVSTGLVAALGADGIAAVLAHEHNHVRHRDPLRFLAVRVAAAYGCWLPASGWLARRAALHRELAADLAAARRTSRAGLAGALLKLASLPASPALAHARAAGDDGESLEARVAQLEGSRPGRPGRAAGRLLASGGTLTLVTVACLCCAALARVLPGGLL